MAMEACGKDYSLHGGQEADTQGMVERERRTEGQKEKGREKMPALWEAFSFPPLIPFSVPSLQEWCCTHSGQDFYP
jgi:hypothetical protein